VSSVLISIKFMIVFIVRSLRDAVSSGYDHIAFRLRGNSLCSFRHTDSCLCLIRTEAAKLAQTGFEDTSWRTLV